jgi:hypothetical protein
MGLTDRIGPLRGPALFPLVGIYSKLPPATPGDQGNKVVAGMNPATQATSVEKEDVYR